MKPLFYLVNNEFEFFFKGYPEFILNPVKLDTYYSGLEIEANEFIRNKVRVNQFMFRKEIALLKQSKDAPEFFE